MEVQLLQQIAARLSVIEQHLGIGGGSTASTEGPVDPPSIRAFDAHCQASLDPFVAACKKLGGDAEAAGNVVAEAWKEMRAFLLMASKCKEPVQAQLGPLLQGVSTQVKAASALVKRNEWEKHAKTCSEGLACLNWLVVKPAPRDFIESFIGGSDYWANGIRKEFRTINPDQIAFCDTFKGLLIELMAYVKEHHTTGVKWNPQGVTPAEYTPGETAPAKAQAAPAAAPASVAAAKPAAAPTGNLFAELSKEGAITSGLKKVTKEMQTWRSEYKAGDAPAPVAAAPKPAAKPAAAPVTKGPPKLEFQDVGNKWLVEYQTSAQGLINIEIKDKKETVYIFGCVDATIQVKGKCKSIIVDSCKKTKVYFDVAMASVEVVNCQRMQIHVLESAAAVAIDKTDGILVHLSATSLHTEVVASKSSEMNLSWPDANGEPIEKPIPEQYVHRIKNGQVTADVSDLYSH